MNCNAVVTGRYCQVCGQENIEPKESVWHLITHFFYDITHFDGKFFSTVKYLLLKPGFLTAEYVRGRRMSYLHPIRMYVFTSAFFFLIYFSFISGHSNHSTEQLSDLRETLALKESQAKKLHQLKDAEHKDTIMSAAISRALTGYEAEIAQLKIKIASAIPDTDSVMLNKTDSILKVVKSDSMANRVIINGNDFFDYNVYKDPDAYLSVQRQLPESRRDGIISRSIKLRLIKIYAEQSGHTQKLQEEIVERFKHSFPKLLFVSLPIFAFFLWLLYLRHKKFYYADHGIFTIHIYCAIFLLILLHYILNALKNTSGWSIFSWLNTGLVLYGIYFVYKAMRNFYGQGRKKTLIKYIILSWMTSIIMVVLMLIFFIITAFNI